MKKTHESIHRIKHNEVPTQRTERAQSVCREDSLGLPSSRFDKMLMKNVKFPVSFCHRAVVIL